MAGSYYIESLTTEIEERATREIEKIDVLGGSVNAIEQGYIQNEISKSAYEFQREIESGEKIIVGVNKFQNKESEKNSLFRIDESIRQTQIEKLESLRSRRDASVATKCLEQIRQAAVDGSNLMPFVIEAVDHYCTLGEIADTLRKVFGEYK